MFKNIGHMYLECTVRELKENSFSHLVNKSDGFCLFFPDDRLLDIIRLDPSIQILNHKFCSNKFNASD